MIRISMRAALAAVVSILALADVTLADQFAVARCDAMRKAHSIVARQKEVYAFCKPCGDTAAKRVVVSAPRVDPENAAPYENCTLRIGGREVDLAYVYVLHNGRLENLAFLAGLAPVDVPRSLALAGGPSGEDAAGPQRPDTRPDAPTPGSADAPYLTQLEREVVDELNRVRTDPAGYAAHLEGMLKFFRGRRYERPGAITLLTKEGAAAVQETIDFLKSAKPLPPFVPSPGMSRAAKDQVNDTGPKGLTGHQGTDGSSVGSRLNRYGTWRRSCGENISYGKNTAREIVIQLLVDDGVPSRGHRKNIFSPKFLRVGVGVGPHRTYRHMCVNTYAGEYVEK
ncbi:MAG TPA: CAP domain-containing protein [Spirochaetota bacterium]|nr:CAP domain-containing protein [Spirochaetota bacterium]HNT11544.1 CAP domain-containing protein [Spirochaetota bacterium]